MAQKNKTMTKKQYVINKFKDPKEHRVVSRHEANYFWEHEGKEFRNNRLAATIGELRKEGWCILTRYNHKYKGVYDTLYEHVPEGDEPPKKKERNWMLPDWD